MFFAGEEVVVVVVRWLEGGCGCVLVMYRAYRRALPGSYLVRLTQGVTG